MLVGDVALQGLLDQGRPDGVSRIRRERASSAQTVRSTRPAATSRSTRLVTAPEVTIDEAASWPAVSS